MPPADFAPPPAMGTMGLGSGAPFGAIGGWQGYPLQSSGNMMGGPTPPVLGGMPGLGARNIGSIPPVAPRMPPRMGMPPVPNMPLMSQGPMSPAPAPGWDGMASGLMPGVAPVAPLRPGGAHLGAGVPLQGVPGGVPLQGVPVAPGAPALVPGAGLDAARPTPAPQVVRSEGRMPPPLTRDTDRRDRDQRGPEMPARPDSRGPEDRRGPEVPGRTASQGAGDRDSQADDRRRQGAEAARPVSPRDRPSPRSPVGAGPPRSPDTHDAGRHFGADARGLEVPDAFDDQPVVATPPKTLEQGQQTTPEKGALVPRRSRKRQAGEPLLPERPRDFRLVQVGMDQFRSWIRARDRPRRHHMRVLEHWRNEQVVYERLPGSALPTVAGVVLAQPLPDQSESDKQAVPLPPVSAQFCDVFSPGKSSNAGSDYTDQDGIADEVLNDKLRTPKTPKPILKKATPKRQPGRPSTSRSRSRTGTRAASTRAAGAAASVAAAKTLSSTGKRPKRSASAGPVLFPEEPAELPQPETRSKQRSSRRSASAPSVRSQQAQVEAPAEVHGDHIEPDDEGFVQVPLAEGSTHPCELRVGLDNGNWMVVDIKIPPRSFNTPETLEPHKSLLIYVLGAERGTLSADLDGEVVDLRRGDSLCVRPGREYCLRNTSVHTYSRLKMVLLNKQEEEEA